MKNESYRFDVYDWMNSRDVADYNRKIGHRFNVMETAYLISENYVQTLAEKWEAYRWIMEHMPDMPVERRNNCGPYDSFHQALQQHMALVEGVLEEFQNPSSDAFYTYRVYADPLRLDEFYQSHDRDTDESWWDSEVYCCSYEECLDAIRKEISEDESGSIRHFDVTKKNIYGNWRETRLISVAIDRDLQVRGIADHMNLGLFREEIDLLDMFDAIWVDVPVPFKEGEIVYTDEREFGRRPRPFSLLHTANQVDRIVRGDMAFVEQKKRSGDSMDMTAHGIWIDQKVRGSVYWECMHAYHNMEYYRGPLEGYDRILKVIEQFYASQREGYGQNEYDMSHVLNAYRYILLEEQCKEVEQKYKYELKAIGAMPEEPAVKGGTKK